MIPNNNFAFIRHIIAPFKWHLIAMSFMLIIGAICETLLNYFIKLILDAIEQSQGLDDALTQKLLFFFLLFLGVRLLIALVWFTYETLYSYFNPIVEKRIKELLLDHVIRHPFSYFQDNFSGQISHKILRAAKATTQYVDILTTGLLFSLVVGSSSLIIFLTLHVDIAITFLIWLSFYIGFNIYAVKVSHIAYKKIENTKSTVTGRLVDIISNNFLVKSFALFNTEQKNFAIHNKDEHDAYRSGILLNRFLYCIKTLLHTSAMLAIPYVAYTLWRDSLISLGDFSLALVMSNHVTTILKTLTRNIFQLTENSATLQDSLDDLIANNDTGYSNQDKTPNLNKDIITLKEMSFSYNGYENVLNNISLNVKENQKIGLIGASGAGKSTLVNLILGFFRAKKDQIFISGKDITTINLENLRQYISYIPQDTSLFHRSIRENIAYARPNADDEDIIHASKKAFAHDFIMALPNGYDTIVGERGVKLSGGQRQRIAIARAILKDAPILILDEATSALDSESEHYIQKSLEDLMQHKTVIAIAHRLSTISHLDHLIVLENGEIIETGSHDTLLKNQGTYATLWNMQSGGFLKD